MNVSSLMQRQAASVRATDSLAAAATLLRDRDCGSVIVVDEGHRPVAVLTDRDVSLAALRLEKTLAAVPVHAAMSRQVFTCRAEDTISDAERMMAVHQVRRLPVVDARGKLVGVLALDDVAREACRDANLLAPPVSCETVGRTLGEICRPRLIIGDAPAVQR